MGTSERRVTLSSWQLREKSCYIPFSRCIDLNTLKNTRWGNSLEPTCLIIIQYLLNLGWTNRLPKKRGASLVVNGKNGQIGFHIVLSHDVICVFSSIWSSNVSSFRETRCFLHPIFRPHISQRWSWETNRRPLRSWTCRLQISVSGEVFIIQRSVSETLRCMLIKTVLLVSRSHTFSDV